MNALQFIFEQTGLKDREEFHQHMLQQLFRSKTVVELFFGEKGLIDAHCMRETHGKTFDLEIICTRPDGEFKIYCELKIWSNLSNLQVKKQVEKFKVLKKSDSDKLVYMLFGISRWTASHTLRSHDELPLQVIDIAHCSAPISADVNRYFFEPHKAPSPGYTRQQLLNPQIIAQIAEELNSKLPPHRFPISTSQLNDILEHYLNASWASYKWFIDQACLLANKDNHPYIHFASRLFHIRQAITERYQDTYLTRFYSDGNQYIHLEILAKGYPSGIPITVKNRAGRLNFLIAQDEFVIQFNATSEAKLERGSDLLHEIRNELEKKLHLPHLAQINSKGKPIQYLRLTKIPLVREDLEQNYVKEALSLVKIWIEAAKAMAS